MTSLTERYLAATLRGLPESKRADVERELRSSIADAVADRVEVGEDRGAAEIAVLEGLGDPTRLAADYAGRPQYLIGPELFEPYRQLLIRLAGVAVPLAAIVVTTLAVAGGRPPIQALLEGLGGAFMVGIQLVFWVTAVFVFIERADAARDARAELVRGRWTVAHLPAAVPSGVTVSETIGELVTLVITIGGLLVLRDLAWVRDAAGTALPILEPSLGNLWLPLLVGLLLALAVLQIVVHVVGRWTVPFAAVYTALNGAFALVFVGLALNGTLVNQAFAAQIGFPQAAGGGSVVMIAVAAGVTVVTAIEILGVWRRALRTRRANGPQAVGNLGATSTV